MARVRIWRWAGRVGREEGVRNPKKLGTDDGPDPFSVLSISFSSTKTSGSRYGRRPVEYVLLGGGHACVPFGVCSLRGDSLGDQSGTRRALRCPSAASIPLARTAERTRVSRGATPPLPVVQGWAPPHMGFGMVWDGWGPVQGTKDQTRGRNAPDDAIPRVPTKRTAQSNAQGTNSGQSLSCHSITDPLAGAPSNIPLQGMLEGGRAFNWSDGGGRYSPLSPPPPAAAKKKKAQLTGPPKILPKLTAPKFGKT